MATQHTHEQMFLFLTLILKMDYNQHNTLKQYLFKKLKCHASFYPLSCSIIDFFYILPFIHFENKTFLTGTKDAMTDLGK